MSLSCAGVPFVRGSWAQYYEKDWSKGYYTTSNTKQKISEAADGTVTLSYISPDGRAFGTQRYVPLTDGVRVEYTVGWNGSAPVNVELTAATLAADTMATAALTADGKPGRAMAQASAAADPIETRTYVRNGKELTFDTAAGKLSMKGGASEWTLYDARNLKQNWAEGKQLLWLGIPTINVPPGGTKTATLEWHFEPKQSVASVGDTFKFSSQYLGEALLPTPSDLPIIPKPKQALVKPDDPMILPTDISVDQPYAYPTFGKEFLRELRRYWELPGMKTHDGNDTVLYLRVQDLGLPPEGYEVRIDRNKAIIMGQDPAGVRNAMRTVAQIAFARNGKLCLPSGIIRDWPSVSWRGVHLFVGPNAISFHQQLWDKVLLPLKLNKAVIECERTNWSAIPGTETPITMKKEELAKLFNIYRNKGVEPIPLIQSFGHMAWLFANDKNLDLAVDQKDAYCIDPDVPRARKVISDIWQEAIDLLKPRTIHFGLDEVDVRGGPKDPIKTSILWESYIPFLASIAQTRSLSMMLWGDQCLAPGQAVDAALGDSMDNARRRRSVVPKGAFIGDWHYKNDEDPERFRSSLELWKTEGMFPIASTWFRRENIRGFYLAAIRAGAGTLQTTWAGNESNEESMLREFRQFEAMVVAADYAWSGRNETSDKLDYRASDVFTRMYFGQPSKLTSTKGLSCGPGGAPIRIGDVAFRPFTPIGLKSLTSPALTQLPSSIKIDTDGLKGTEIALALDTALAAEDGQPVADVKVELTDGSSVEEHLVYGRHVRNANDLRPISMLRSSNGLSCLRIPLDKEATVKRIVITSTSSFAGLRLHGITAF